MKTTRFSFSTLWLMAICACSFTLFSCESDVQDEREELTEEQQDVAEARREGESAEEIMQEQRDVYRQQVDLRLAKLDSTIQVLEERVENARGRTKQEYEAQLAELRRERDEFNTRLNNLQNATADTWNDTRNSIDTALSNLEREYNQALEAMQTNN